MKLYSISEAGKLIGITRQAIQHAVQVGNIQTFRKNPTLIEEKEVQEYLTFQGRKYAPKKRKINHFTLDKQKKICYTLV